MASVTLILGGARSGKSDFAEALAEQPAGPVLYVATAEALDEEMRTRVAAHQARRPAHWTTLEVPLQVGAALRSHPQAAGAGVVLLDCLTLLVSNVILSEGPNAPELDVDTAWDRVRAEVEALLAAQQDLGCHLVVVSNEVGLGVVPPYSLGRTYRDCLGWANQRLAEAADQVIWLVAGLALDLKALPLVRPGDVASRWRQ